MAKGLSRINAVRSARARAIAEMPPKDAAKTVLAIQANSPTEKTLAREVYKSMRTKEFLPFSVDVLYEFEKRVLQDGRTITSVCNDPDMPDYAMLVCWGKKYTQAREIIDSIKHSIAQLEMDQALEIADNVFPDKNELRKADLQIKIRTQRAAKMDRENWGDTKGVSLTVNNNHLTVTSDLHTAIKAALQGDSTSLQQLGDVVDADYTEYDPLEDI